jgi:drug/metabolite transporter (DMT)-like permease
VRNALFVLAFGAFLVFARGGVSLPRRAWFASVLLAFFMGVWTFGYLSSVAYIPVSLAALLFFTFPLLVGLIAVITGQDRLTFVKAFALVIAFVGLVLAFGPALDTLDWRGVALALSASVAVAVAHVFIAPIFRQYDSVSINFLAHLWMLLGFAVYGFAMHDFVLPRHMDGQLFAMASMLLYIAAYTLWSVAIAWIGPVRTAGMMNLEPVISLVVAALVLGERLGRVQIAGGALVLIALMLVARTPRPRRAR